MTLPAASTDPLRDRPTATVAAADGVNGPMRREILFGDRLVRCFADRPASVDAMFRHAVANRADHGAVAIGDQVETYAALGEKVDRLAANLAAAGFQAGERIALLLGNQLEFVYCFLAAARLGVVSVPLNTRQRREEVRYALRQCGASALIFAAEHEDAVPPPGDVPGVRRAYRVGTVDGCDFSELLGPCDHPGDWPVAAGSDTLCVLYTSGTTGKPKGAMLTNVGAVHSTLHYVKTFGLRPGDTSLLAVPISHVTGFVAMLLVSIQIGGCMVMLPAFKARAFLDLAARWRMNYTLMVPTMYNLILLDPDLGSADLSAWRVGGFGGAPMTGATIDRLRSALPRLELCNVYGATETTSPTTILPPGDIGRRPDSVGKSVACADIVIVDEGGVEVPPGKVGELLVAGPMVVPGYWNDPDSNRASFIAGYWRSGDLGYVDVAGYVYVVDRKKDMINRGGFKVYAAEVEATCAAMPGVVEAAVVGVPDPVLGERVHAFLVVQGASVDAEQVRRHCSLHLSDYKVPELLTFRGEPLPRNANGKVLKHLLRASDGDGPGQPHA